MLEIVIALGCAIFFGATGDILLSAGMQSNGEVKVRKTADILPLIKRVFSRPLVLLGVLSMAFYFGAYMTALVWVDVSVANPMTALSYLIATIYAATIMRERIRFMRGAGIVLITVGAILVGLSS